MLFKIINKCDIIIIGGSMKKNKKILLIISLLIIFGLIYLLNSKTLYVSDDYIYHYVFDSRVPTTQTKRVESFFELFHSMASHYKIWGGRVVAHFILQFVFMFSENTFNVFNSLMFVIFGLLIYRHIDSKKNINILLLLFIYAMIFVFIPQPGSTLFWKSGSANYLWSSNLMLVLTLIYKKHYEDSNKIKDNYQNTILLFIYGMIAGCLNENSGCALIVLEILFTIYYKFKDNYIPKWCISSIVGTITGYIILLIAPGNFVRADVMYEKVDYSIEGLFKNFFILTRLTSDYLRYVVFILIISCVMAYQNMKTIKEFVLKYFLQINYIIFSLISVYSLIVSPAFPERCWFFCFIYMLITICINIISLKKDQIIFKKIALMFSFAMIFCALSEYGVAYYTIDLSHEQLKDQEAEIIKQKNAGKKAIVVRPIYTHTGKYNAFTENGHLSSTKESWFNSWMAKYFGVDSIETVD